MKPPLSVRGAAAALQPASGPQRQPVPQPQYETLANVSTAVPESVPAEVNHYTVQRVIDINANLQGRDLGSVVGGIANKIDAFGKLPHGIPITLHCQDPQITQSFRKLAPRPVLALY